MRSFPIVYATRFDDTVAFYERLGFERTFELPGYISLRRDESTMAVVSADWPRDRYGMEMGSGPRFELFVYVADVDATFATLVDAGVSVIAPPDDMTWGERVGFVIDPEGNPVALAQEP